MKFITFAINIRIIVNESAKQEVPNKRMVDSYDPVT